jgi:hypothetical protein
MKGSHLFLLSRSKGMIVDIWIRDYNSPRCFQKKISGRSKHNELSLYIHSAPFNILARVPLIRFYLIPYNHFGKGFMNNHTKDCVTQLSAAVHGGSIELSVHM